MPTLHCGTRPWPHSKPLVAQPLVTLRSRRDPRNDALISRCTHNTKMHVFWRFYDDVRLTCFDHVLTWDAARYSHLTLCGPLLAGEPFDLRRPPNKIVSLHAGYALRPSFRRLIRLCCMTVLSHRPFATRGCFRASHDTFLKNIDAERIPGNLEMLAMLKRSDFFFGYICVDEKLATRPGGPPASTFCVSHHSTLVCLDASK